ncbi:MAG: reverse transcriptase domain-containing protein [Brevinema sp.]
MNEKEFNKFFQRYIENQKNTAHFDAPIKIKYKQTYYSFLTNPNNIAKYAFLPFIGYDITERRYSKIKHISYSDRKIYRREKIKENTENENKILKERPIRYASHKARLIYSYYAKMLSDLYESKLTELGLQERIFAYRPRPEHYESKGLAWNNITMAKEVFTEIKDNRNNDCYIYLYDIEGFFSNLSHNILKNRWISLLGQSELPKDHYNIFKSLTKYCYINKIDLLKYFKKELKEQNLERRTRTSTGKIQIEKLEQKGTLKVSQKGYQYNRRFTDMALLKILQDNFYENPLKFREFRNDFKKKGGKFQINTDPIGIPQGTPISALLSNIYMLDFDKQLLDLSQKYNLFFRRYSDDIVIVSPPNKDVKREIEQFIKNWQEEKKETVKIHELGTKSLFINFTKVTERKRLSYLGFTFDGETVCLRSSGISKYYRKMTMWIRSSTRGLLQKHKRLGSQLIGDKIFSRKIYKLYSHTKISIKSSKSRQNFHQGNYIDYVKRADNLFKDGFGSNIKSTLRNHSNILKRRIDGANKCLKIALKKPDVRVPIRRYIK